MPEFTDPLFLWLLPLTPLVPLWLARRRRPALRFSDLSLFDGLPTGRAAYARRFGPAWRFVVTFAVVLALAGPRWPDPDSAERLPSEGIAISLVLDVSGSMATPDFRRATGPPISRFEAAKQSLRLFLAGDTDPDGPEFTGRADDRAGLVTFAVWPDAVCPLTLSHDVLLDLLERQTIAGPLEEGSNVGDAIARGVLQLEAAAGQRKVLVLFTDGEHNFDLAEPRRPLKPRQSAQLAAARDVTIYAIDTGGEPIPPPEAAGSAAREAYEQRAEGRAILEAVAGMTNGRMFPAGDADAMRDALTRIDELERVAVPSFRYRRHRESRPWLALTAVAVLLAGWLVERTTSRTLP